MTVEGQVLTPREPVSATVYANVSNTVVDNAITPTKVATGYGLVPQGAIMIFETSCPTGWTEYTKLQGRFPAGVDPSNQSQFAVGFSSGSLNHTHVITPDGTHSHQLTTTPTSNTGNYNFTVIVGAGGQLGAAQSGIDFSNTGATIFTNSTPNHSHGGATGTSSTLPPYLTVVFCQKL